MKKHFIKGGILVFFVLAFLSVGKLLTINYSNLISDGDMESSGINQWINYGVLSIKEKISSSDFGSQVIHFATENLQVKTTGGIQQELSVATGHTYELSFVYKVIAGSLLPKLSIYGNTNYNKLSDFENNNIALYSKNVLQVYTRRFTMPSNYFSSNKFFLRLIMKNGLYSDVWSPGEIFLDDVSILEVDNNNLLFDGNMEANSAKTWLSYGFDLKQKVLTEYYSGLRSMYLNTIGTSAGFQQTKIPVEAGEKYLLTVYYKVNSGRLNIRLGDRSSNVDFQTNDPNFVQTIKDSYKYSTAGQYLEYTREFIAPTTSDFRLVFSLKNGEAYIDDVSLVKIDSVIEEPIVPDPTPTTTPNPDPITPISTPTPTTTPNPDPVTPTSTPTPTTTPPVVPTGPEVWKCDVDGDGNEDHADTGVETPNFIAVCQLSEDLWDTANFGSAMSQIQGVINKLNQYESANLNINSYRSLYKQLCLDNDKDGDQVYRQGPYYGATEAGSGCAYNDKDDNVSNRLANNCTTALFIKLPLDQGGTTPPGDTGGGSTPPPDTGGGTTPPGDTGGGTGGTGTFNPTPHEVEETYSNIQEVNFNLFPTLRFEDYTGNTYYVSLNGNDTNAGTLTSPLRTISRGLAVANNGDKVLVRGGTYVEPYANDYYILNIKSAVYLGAYNNENVILQASSSADAAKRGIGFSAKENIVVDGFTINGFTTNVIGFWETGYKNIVLKNLTINIPNTVQTSEGIVFYSTGTETNPVIRGLKVENVTINNAGLIGMACGSGPCNDWKISNLKINNRATGGGSGADCFAMENGQNVFLKNVEVSNCSADGIDLKAHNVLVLNPWVHNIGRNGMKLWHGADIVNALVYDTGADSAVVFKEGGIYRLINSTIALHNYNRFNSDGTRAHSYLLSAGYDTPTHTTDVRLINTIFYKNSSQSNDSRNFIGYPNWGSANRSLTIENCLFYDVPLGDVESKINSSIGNLKNVDPLFVNPTINGDFQLQSSSPALNIGQNTVYNFDRVNNIRNSNSYDLGVYER